MQQMQPKNLLDFLNQIVLNPDGTIYTDGVESLNNNTLSEPEFKVSVASSFTLDAIKGRDTFNYAPRRYRSELVDSIKDAQLKYKEPELYKLLQISMLEAFTLVLIQDISPRIASKYTDEDANRLHSNLTYTINKLVEKEVFNFGVITELRTLDVDTAYMYKTISGVVK